MSFFLPSENWEKSQVCMSFFVPWENWQKSHRFVCRLFCRRKTGKKVIGLYVVFFAVRKLGKKSKVVSNQSDLVRLKRSQKCHSEMSSSQNSIFSFICIAYTPDFRANFGHLPVNAEGHKNMHTFSRMPAISQKWFQINRTSYGWKGLWNVVQKAPIDLTLVTFWPL